jgi:transposase
MTVDVCGLDLGKTVFHLIGMSEQGHIVVKKRLSRKQLIALTVNMPVCESTRLGGVALGLVPRQDATGGKTRLLGISKRGDPCLRKLFVYGARAVITRIKRDEQSFGEWLNRIEARFLQELFLQEKVR